jgi:diguanylate cyclase (GGDEF)-like protein
MGMAARRQDRVWHLAIAVIDLDGLKQVNDEYGHGAGDAVIVAAAERIRAATRPGDTVARFGGDEFVVVLEGLTSGDELRSLGERIANALRVPVPWDDRYLRVGASIGIADAAEAPVDPRELLRRADEAMYIAKRAGGGLALAAV